MARRARITGGSNVRRLLRRLDDNVVASVKREVADFGEATRQDGIKAVAPVSKTIARNIEVRKSRDGLTVRVGIITKKARRAAYFSRWVEFGTRPHRIGSGMHPGVQPKPFLIPSFKINKAYYRPRINAAISRAIRTAARGGTITDPGGGGSSSDE